MVRLLLCTLTLFSTGSFLASQSSIVSKTQQVTEIEARLRKMFIGESASITPGNLERATADKPTMVALLKLSSTAHSIATAMQAKLSSDIEKQKKDLDVQLADLNKLFEARDEAKSDKS